MRDEVRQAYATLNLSPSASLTDVRARYKTLVRTWHPDRFQADPIGQKEAAQRMQQINHAYELLTDAAGQPDDPELGADIPLAADTADPPVRVSHFDADTRTDKIMRFSLGAILGMSMACGRSWLSWSPRNDLEGWALIVGHALVGGIVAIFFGRRLSVWFSRR